MYQLSIISAASFVRTALDELETVEEIGLLVDADAVNLQRLVVNSIVEAVVTTHSRAIPSLIDGVRGVQKVKSDDESGNDEASLMTEENGEVEQEADFEIEKSDDGIVTITMLQDTLRIASVQEKDSPVVVCDILPEFSAEGRKQLNKYVRGVPDDPRVVLQQRWKNNYKPILKYYTTDKTNPEILLEYIPYPVLTESIIEICPRLEYAVLNELTAMILDSVKEHDKAALYRAKSQAITEGK